MKKIFLSLVVLSATLLSSCSVAMAANKSGVAMDKVQSCRTRGQMISTGAVVIGSETTANGELVECYQIQKEKGSAARALMHGALDVCTCGVWEVVGTPIEACDQKEFYCVKVFYDESEVIKKIELM